MDNAISDTRKHAEKLQLSLTELRRVWYGTFQKAGKTMKQKARGLRAASNSEEDSTSAQFR